MGMCQSMESESGLVKCGGVLGGVVHVVIDQLGVKVRGGGLVGSESKGGAGGGAVHNFVR